MGKHSDNCIYGDDVAMLYCILKLDDYELLLSVREVQFFDQYLALAHDEDKDVTIDMDAADHNWIVLTADNIGMKEDCCNE